MDERLLQQNPWLKNEALSWLARLPFLDAYELSLLLDINTKKAQWLLHDLESIHWVDQISPSSPEFETQPLHLLATGAVSALSCQLGLTESEVEGKLPVGQRDTVRRLARIEPYTYMNRIFAELANDLRKEHAGWIAELRARPLSRRSNSLPWWPPGIEGYGCLRSSSGWAPFFAAMDRLDATFFHRRRRIAAWHTFRDEVRGWGDDWLPPIFVVSGSPQSTAQWSRIIAAAADRRLVNPLDVRLADVDTVFAKGFLSRIWDEPDGGTRSNLHQALSWINEPDATFAPWLRGDNAPPPLPPQPKLQSWANQVAVSLASHSSTRGTAETLGALALVLTATDKTAVEVLGRHPMLTPQELGVMLNLDRRHTERLVAGLLRDHLIEALPPLKDEPSAEPRYLLAELALKLLAARDGVPYQTYVQGGRFLGHTQDAKGQHRLGPLLFHPEHTAGINRFMVSMMAASQDERPKLARWFGHAESTFWLTNEGARNWLQPDGLGELRWRNQTRRFLVEWDRGTMRWREMREKLDRYALLHCSSTQASDTVIVTNSPQRESSIWECWESTMAARDAPSSLLLTSVESLVTRVGPFGRVWRMSASDLSRYTWAEAIDLWEPERADSANQQPEDCDD